jgi:hypothetical protein
VDADYSRARRGVTTFGVAGRIVATLAYLGVTFFAAMFSPGSALLFLILFVPYARHAWRRDRVDGRLPELTLLESIRGGDLWRERSGAYEK